MTDDAGSGECRCRFEIFPNSPIFSLQIVVDQLPPCVNNFAGSLWRSRSLPKGDDDGHHFDDHSSILFWGLEWMHGGLWWMEGGGGRWMVGGFQVLWIALEWSHLPHLKIGFLNAEGAGGWLHSGARHNKWRAQGARGGGGLQTAAEWSNHLPRGRVGRSSSSHGIYSTRSQGVLHVEATIRSATVWLLSSQLANCEQ
jgi:hypothetical protein